MEISKPVTISNQKVSEKVFSEQQLKQMQLESRLQDLEKKVRKILKNCNK